LLEDPVVARFEDESETTNLEAVSPVLIVPVKLGLAIVGDVPNTKDPDPVSSVIEAAKTDDVAEVERVFLIIKAQSEY
jgi:hypothetical protein